MTTASEAAGARTALGAALKAGLDALDLNQEITFDLYSRVVLPVDGFVFWVKVATMSETALLGASQLNSFELNEPVTVSAFAPQLKIMGSLHYASDLRQEATYSTVVSRVIFTAEEPVRDLNAIGPNYLYIATFDNVRFAFSSRETWYQQANLWHYVGHSINSPMTSQVVDDPRLLMNRQVVSNSLPAWLSLNSRTVPWLPYWPVPRLMLYPSFLSPLNAPPTYGVVHVEPERTEAVQSVPLLGPYYERQQLARDHVDITLWGCGNDFASDFMDMVIDWFNTEAPIGLLNAPEIRDLKYSQVELLAIGQQKRIMFDVSYNQAAMRNLARQLILSAFVTIEPWDDIVPVPI
jgi:hypothetical protein